MFLIKYLYPLMSVVVMGISAVISSYLKVDNMIKSPNVKQGRKKLIPIFINYYKVKALICFLRLCICFFKTIKTKEKMRQTSNILGLVRFKLKDELSTSRILKNYIIFNKVHSHLNEQHYLSGTIPKIALEKGHIKGLKDSYAMHLLHHVVENLDYSNEMLLNLRVTKNVVETYFSKEKRENSNVYIYLTESEAIVKGNIKNLIKHLF